MTKKIKGLTWKDVPCDYPMCVLADCTRCDTCLRQIALRLVPEKEWLVKILNPKRCESMADCKYYKVSAPQTYARGFKKMQQELLPRQYNMFKTRLQREFGRNEYYRRRRGERPMPPSEQAFILMVLKEIGASDNLKFDSYEERVAWYD